MKAVCPNNPDHKEFITSAHEVHDWVVDQNGEFIKDICCTEISARPNIDNTWICNSCREIAVVSN